MYIVSNVVYYLFHAYTLIMLIYCVLSWFPGSRGSGTLGDIYRIFAKVCDPLLNIFRKIIPPIGGTIDISPIIAIFVLQIVANFVIRLLFTLV